MTKTIKNGFRVFIWWVTVGILVALAAGCADDVAETNSGLNPAEFISADETLLGADGSVRAPGVDYSNTADDDVAMVADGDADMDIDADADGDWAMDTDAGESVGDLAGDAVVEGDLYRVFNGGTLLNLNSYRGLQVIDVSQPETPTIVGRYPLHGTPVEMYAFDNKAVVLFNNWQGYQSSGVGLAVEQFNGGLVVTIDLTDVTHPKLVSQQLVEGSIVTSRMVQGVARKALYLAAANSEGTLVQSFSVANTGILTPASEMLLTDNISDITATATALLVARTVWENTEYSVVSYIDISDPAGQMVLASEVQTQGIVQKKTDMSLSGNILRIVSARAWDSTFNHLQTWDVTDVTHPVPVDHDTFGENEDLYATLFLGNSAFFVTFFQTDPFHAFEIDNTGVATEHTEYIISGWNDFFKPAFDQTRIVGIGRGDEGLAVSLYDTALDNDSPFITRVELGNNVFGSEASWDDRAFTVLEDAVSAMSADGVEETGLVLLPYSAWNENTYTEESGVQILTFSPTSLTLRGSMINSGMVRRSFLIEDDAVANMSEEELNLFDFSDPDAPALLGSVELAPEYSNYFVLGQHAVRVKAHPSEFWPYMYCETGMARASAADKTGALEVLPIGSDPNSTNVLASVAISPYAQVFFKGPLAVLVSPVESCTEKGALQWVVETIDFSNPGAPVKLGTLTTTLENYEHNTRQHVYYDGCFGGGCMSNSALSNGRLVGNSLVIPSVKSHSETLEEVLYCETYARDEWSEIETDTGWMYTYVNGSIVCITGEDGIETCSGTLEKCTESYDHESGNDSYECATVDPDTVDTQYTCWNDDVERHWNSYVFEIVDLSDPTNPSAAPAVEMPDAYEAAGLLVENDQLYISHKTPYEKVGDSKAYVKYYVSILNLDTPAAPVISKPVNIPGAVFAAAGQRLITRDSVWTGDRIDTTINTVVLGGTSATRVGSRKFENTNIKNIVVDKLGRAFVTTTRDTSGENGGSVAVSDCDYDFVVDDEKYYGDYCYSSEMNNLLVINTKTSTLPTLGEMELASWSSLQLVSNHRALLSVPGGLLVVNATDASTLTPQAFFPTNGWEHTFNVVGSKAVVTAGRYGIYNFDLNINNLVN